MFANTHKKLDKGGGIAETPMPQKAKLHKSCRNEFSTMKLKRANKQSQDPHNVLSYKSVLKAKVDIQEREINELYGQQDDLEQYTRKHSKIEIRGIPENLYTSTYDVVIKLGERLDVPIVKEEIDITHKLYNGKNHPKSIIVKFINYKKKAQLYRKRTELKNVKISDLFSTCSVADVAQSTRII